LRERLGFNDSDTTLLLIKSKDMNQQNIGYRFILKKVRYWCFRYRTEATGGAKATGAPDDLKEIYEAQDCFDDWENFGINWDLNEFDMTEAVKRLYTMYEEWDAVLRQVVPVLKVSQNAKKNQTRIQKNINEAAL